MDRKAIRALLAGDGRVAECRVARAAWVKEAMVAWREAQRAMDDRCDAAVARLSEEEFERLCDEEEAKVEVFRGPLKDAAERDVWPKHLYFGGL